MKPFLATVSLAALMLSPASAPAAQAPAAEPTPEGARAYVAAAEKDLHELGLIGARAAWVNETYVNDDTDAVATYFGAIGNRERAQIRQQAARFAAVPGLDPDTKRKLDLLRGSLGLAAPTPPAPRPSSTR